MRTRSHIAYAGKNMLAVGLASITTEPFRASEHYVGWSEKRDKWAPSGFVR